MNENAQYTEDDVKRAVESNLISPDDAQFLLSQLQGGGQEDSGYGGMIGGGLGALAGAGLGAVLGNKGGNKLAAKFGGPADETAQSFGNRMARGFGDHLAYQPEGRNLGVGSPAEWAAGALGTGLGGWGGAELGGMMGGAPSSGSDERDQLLQALMDPNTPPGEKKQILQMLQQMDAGAQEQPVDDGSSGGALSGAAWGGGAGAGLGLGAGLGATSDMFNGKPRFTGANKAMAGGLGGLGGAALGAGLGAGIGAMMGPDSGPPSPIDPRQKYRDPLGQGQ
jgi:hypothetical protein